MLHFMYFRRNSFKFCVMFLILALQECQLEAKHLIDIYTTLLGIIKTETGSLLPQVDCSLKSNSDMNLNNSRKSLAHSHPGISFNGSFTNDVNDMKVYFNVSIERGSRFDTYLSVDIDVCKLVNSKVQHPLLEFLRNEIFRLIKPASRCPFKKNILYEVNNLVLSNKFLPVWAPTLNWKAELKFLLNARYIFDVIVMALQECQLEAKLFIDIYPTLFGIIKTETGSLLPQVDCSLKSNGDMKLNNSRKSLAHSHPGISFGGTFSNDVNDMKVYFNVSIERGNRYDKYLSLEVDVCEMANSKVKQPILEFLRNEIFRLIRPATRCPFRKDVAYKVNNLILTNKFVPVYAPTLNWKADLSFVLNGQYKADAIVIGRIERINI